VKDVFVICDGVGTVIDDNYCGDGYTAVLEKEQLHRQGVNAKT
jgi:hypothetical protein